MQQKLETGEQDFSQQRVVAALTSLSSLALQTSMLRFSPPEAVDHLATVFLEQLVTLCEAQQGALFLIPQHLTTQETVLMSPTLPLIARTRLSAKEAQAALTSAVPIPVDPLTLPVELPTIMSWTRSLDTAFSHVVHSGEVTFPVVSLCSFVLLFTWPVIGPATQHEGQRQAIQLLPFLADLVDTILLHVLTALYEGKQPVEVFPTELLATVGHEFRGPLTTIQGYATTLQRYDQQLALDERQDFLRAISEASVHLGKLVDRFLDLAQFENNVHTFVLAEVNLLALAQEAITALQKSQTHHLQLSPSLEKNMLEADADGERVRDGLTMSGDRRLLRTMLDIFLENAIAYSAPESLVEVSIEPITAASVLAIWHPHARSGIHRALILSARFQERESLIAIRIRDHGIGISPEHLALIFRRFYRVDTSLTRNVNGLGLGLAVCKAIVALHGGMLWVESRLGKGSTFALILPRGFFPEANESVEVHIRAKERLE